MSDGFVRLKAQTPDPQTAGSSQWSLEHQFMLDPIAGKFLFACQSNAAGEPSRSSPKKATAESLPAGGLKHVTASWTLPFPPFPTPNTPDIVSVIEGPFLHEGVLYCTLQNKPARAVKGGRRTRPKFPSQQGD